MRSPWDKAKRLRWPQPDGLLQIVTTGEKEDSARISIQKSDVLRGNY